MGTDASVKVASRLSPRTKRSTSRTPTPPAAFQDNIPPSSQFHLTSSLFSSVSKVPPSNRNSTLAVLPAPCGLPAAPTYSTLYVSVCVGYYFAVSLSLTFLNKMVLTTFACPLFMTWLQFFVAFICLKTLGYAGRVFPAIPCHIGIREYSFSRATFSKTAALGVAYVAMVGITNVTLYNVNLLLFQFVRALVIPFSIIITFHSNRSLPSMKACVACSFVVIGFMIGALSDTDKTSTWQGIAYGVMSALVCAIYGVQVKRALAEVLGDDTFKTLYYNTIWGLFLLLPFIWFFERSILLAELAALCSSRTDVMFFFFTAVMGFMISISYVLNIRCSTPLTSHILGNSKSALQSILVLFIPSFKPRNSSDELNIMNIFGLFVVIAASLSYSLIQYHASRFTKLK